MKRRRYFNQGFNGQSYSSVVAVIEHERVTLTIRNEVGGSTVPNVVLNVDQVRDLLARMTGDSPVLWEDE